MKYITTSLLVAVFGALLLPLQTFALSCMPADMMLENYVEDENFVIVKATALELVEHVSQPAEEDYLHDEGFTGQRIAITESLKGYVEDDMWVYWRVDATWKYLCAGAPPAEGTENLYIIRNSNDSFGLTMVVDVYPADSELATQIKTALSEADVTGTVNETSSERWVEQLTYELKQMVFTLRIKLAEWRFWQGNPE